MSKRVAGVVKLGNFISEGGKVTPLRKVIGQLERPLPESGGIPSRGLAIVPKKARCIKVRTSRTMKSGRVRKLLREEVLLEEIKRFATSKPMYIIGVIMILVELGYNFSRIKECELRDLLANDFPEQNISLSEVYRVMRKIRGGALGRALKLAMEMGLKEAYLMYL